MNFNTYLNALMSLEGDALKEWNRESARRMRMLRSETGQRERSNVESYMSNQGVDQTLVKEDKIFGELNVKWEIEIASGEMTLRLSVGNQRAGDYQILAEYDVCNRVTAERFARHIHDYLCVSVKRLFTASFIYSGEVVTKSNPQYRRQKLLHEATEELNYLTGKPAKVGRRTGTFKNCLQREDESVEEKPRIVKAIRDLRRENERVSKAAVAEHMSIGGKKTRTQAMTNLLNRLRLSWKELLREANSTK